MHSVGWFTYNGLRSSLWVRICLLIIFLLMFILTGCTHFNRYDDSRTGFFTLLVGVLNIYQSLMMIFLNQRLTLTMCVNRSP